MNLPLILKRKEDFQIAGHAIGASIPISEDCQVSIVAYGKVTKQAISKLVDYLNLVKPSFPIGE